MNAVFLMEAEWRSDYKPLSWRLMESLIRGKVLPLVSTAISEPCRCLLSLLGKSLVEYLLMLKYLSFFDFSSLSTSNCIVHSIPSL